MLVNGWPPEVPFHTLSLNTRPLKESNKYYMKNKYPGGTESDD